MVIFAAGNKYKVEEIRWSEKQGWIVTGYKMIKSKGTYSKSCLQHAIGPQYEEIKE